MALQELLATLRLFPGPTTMTATPYSNSVAERFSPYAGKIAEVAAALASALASTAEGKGDWCHSIMFAPGIFEREIVETLEIVGNIRRATVPGELVRVDFNLHNRPIEIEKARELLRSRMAPLTKRFGGVIQDTPEGLMVLDGNLGGSELKRANHGRADS
jgi:hypothetical protein